jgi:hypothetical protein
MTPCFIIDQFGKNIGDEELLTIRELIIAHDDRVEPKTAECLLFGKVEKELL